MWLTSLFVVVLSCVIAWVYARWKRVSTYWARRNIPHLPPHPIYGSLTILQKKNIGIWMREMYSQFKSSPYIGIWCFWRPALIINSPDLARRILIKDSDIFRDRFLSSGKSDPIGGLNVFTVNDPTWSTVRRRLTPVFTTAKLRVMQDLIRAKAKELCQRIQNEADMKKRVDIKDILTDYSTDLVGTAAFGVECNATLTGDCAMRRITRQFQTYSFFRGIAHSFIFFFPKMVDICRFSFYPKVATDYFREIFKTVVEKRGGFNRNMTECKDLLDYLVKMKQDAAIDKEMMSEDLLVAQATVFVHGGFETSSGTLAFIIYELAHCPEAQEKLYQEILGIKENLGDKDFDIDVLSEAVYLNCVFKEVLRKFPTMGWLDRIAAKDYKIDDNLTIQAGTPVYINAIGLQSDPDYFPDPEKFIPERFLPEQERNIKPFTYLPFGDGPRSCIGMRFAHQTIRFALANIVLNFEMRPWPNTPTPNETELEKNSMFLMAGEMLSVEFIPRERKQ